MLNIIRCGSQTTAGSLAREFCCVLVDIYRRNSRATAQHSTHKSKKNQQQENTKNPSQAKPRMNGGGGGGGRNKASAFFLLIALYRQAQSLGLLRYGTIHTHACVRVCVPLYPLIISCLVLFCYTESDSTNPLAHYCYAESVSHCIISWTKHALCWYR